MRGRQNVFAFLPGFAFLSILFAGCASPGGELRTVKNENNLTKNTMGGECWRAIGPGEIRGSGQSPVFEVSPFDRAVVSCNANFSSNENVTIQLRVRAGGDWSDWMTMLQFQNGRYKSAKQKPSGFAKVEVDTFVVSGGLRADAWQLQYYATQGVRPTFTTFRSLGVTWYDTKTKVAFADRGKSPTWGTVFNVESRSQTVEDPKIAARICSPTSTSMALDYFGAKLTTAAFAQLVYDPESDLYGNWSVNVSTAAEVLRGEAFAVHMRDFTEIENEIIQNRPVVLSHSWKKGELSNAPIESSSGHLILVIGFTKEGDLVVNDPAAKPGEVRRIYKRNEIARTWQKNGAGIVYIFRPARND